MQSKPRNKSSRRKESARNLDVPDGFQSRKSGDTQRV